MITQSHTFFINFSPYFGTYGLFLGLVFGALLLSFTPLKYPFQWLETYYHELSHGIAALMSGGRILRIKLNTDGSGWCRTSGGSRFIILLAGYTGASLWGAALYLAGWKLGVNSNLDLLYVMIALLGITIVLWMRDLITLFITLTAMALYASPIVFPSIAAYTSLYLQFTGIYVMLNALRAPLHLIDGQHVGDGAALADLTFIFPEGVWILLWLLFSLATVVFSAALTLPGLQWVWWFL